MLPCNETNQIPTKAKPETSRFFRPVLGSRKRDKSHLPRWQASLCSTGHCKTQVIQDFEEKLWPKKQAFLHSTRESIYSILQVSAAMLKMCYQLESLHMLTSKNDAQTWYTKKPHHQSPIPRSAYEHRLVRSLRSINTPLNYPHGGGGF